ncbi:MAG: Gx transporter family protein [Parasporobacterium sp.]|nr:Gx transporter family protein [Parasporobacterium sp.]
MSKGKHVALLGILCAAAMILTYIEVLIPIPLGIPGVKPGLANIAVVFALYSLGKFDAIIINVVRIVVTGLLFGSLFSILFSLAGAVASFLVMALLKRLPVFSYTGVSIAGGITHNLAQLVVAIFVVGAAEIAFYIPVLLISGTVTGLIIGLVAALLIKKVPLNRIKS